MEAGSSDRISDRIKDDKISHDHEEHHDIGKSTKHDTGKTTNHATDESFPLEQLTEEQLTEEQLTEEQLTEEQLTEDEIIANIILVLVAGYDTTASTITYAMYSLAMNPVIQEKLRTEVNEAMDANDTKS